MSIIFISHSSTDNADATRIATWLRDRGHQSVFLDFDPELGIPAGRDWEAELYRTLRTCRAVIVLCSVASMASKWVFAEVTQARALGKHILPLRIEDCTIDATISDRQIIDFASDPATGFDRLWSGLLAAGIDPADIFEWDGKRPPYPGLLSFQEDDAGLFFGRDDEIRLGLDLLNRARRTEFAKFVAVVGASGSGKSSLVRAGIVPRLRRDPERWLVLHPIRPRDEPIREISAALANAFSQTPEPRLSTVLRNELATDLESDAAQAAGRLVDLGRQLLALSQRDAAHLLLVIDQFEEFLGPSARLPRAERTLEMLRVAVDSPGSPIVVMITMRSDFVADFQTSPPLLDLDYEMLSLGPMSSDDVARIIEEPARIAGIELESGLTSLLVAESLTGQALPLLAFTLRELWEKYGADGRLTIEEYRDDLGGLEGAVGGVAADVIRAASLDAPALAELRRAMLAMVRLSDDGRFVRRPVQWSELPASVHPVIERFVAARLLVSGGEGDDRVLEVAHEALFRSWGLLARWLDENVESLRLHRDLERATASWVDGGQSVADVWRGARLGRAMELSSRGDLLLGAREAEFVEASQQVQQAEADREEKRRQRRLQVIGIVAIGALALAGTALVFFFIAQQRADEATEAAIVALARQARAQAATDPPLAVGLAAEAYQRSMNPETVRAVLETRAALHRSGLLLSLSAGAATARGAAFSPDGGQLAVAYADGTARIWDATTGESLVVLEGHDRSVRSVAYSSNGAWLATASADQRVRIWDTASWQEVETLPAHADTVRGAAFSPDSRWLATASADNSVRVSDTTTWEILAVLSGHSDSVRGVAFSPDNALIASASEDATARIWDTTTWQTIATLAGHTGPVRDVAFSPDGSRIATASADRTARIWTTTGDEVATLRGHRGPLFSVAYSPDGTRIATAGADGELRLWDAASGELVTARIGHTGPLFGVTFSPDSSRVATASGDATARVWAVAPRSALRTLAADDGELFGVGFNPDGTHIATASADGTARIWDTTTGDTVATLQGHDGPIRSITYNPDGTHIATASADGTARIWDTTTGNTIATLRGHDGPVRSITYNPDGTHIATASADGTARIWDATTGDTLTTLVGHANSVWGVSYNPDGSLLATASDDGTARTWDAVTGDTVATLQGHDGPVRSITYNPDGTHIATASADGTARIWDATTGDTVATLVGHANSVWGVSYNPDGSLLATASFDGTARIWDAERHRTLAIFEGHTDWVFAAAFNADGTLLATASADGTANIWDTRTDDSCELVERLLTQRRLQEALGQRPEACTDLLR